MMIIILYLLLKKSVGRQRLGYTQSIPAHQRIINASGLIEVCHFKVQFSGLVKITMSLQGFGHLKKSIGILFIRLTELSYCLFIVMLIQSNETSQKMNAAYLSSPPVRTDQLAQTLKTSLRRSKILSSQSCPCSIKQV